MFNYRKIADDAYVVYVNGIKMTPIPLTKDELKEKLCEIKLSDKDVLFIDNFYSRGGDGGV